MRRWLLVLCVVACKKSSEPARHEGSATPVVKAPADAAPPVPHARLVLVSGKTAQLVDIDGDAAKVTATVPLPQAPSALVWAGADPIAMFASSGLPPEAGVAEDPKLDGTAGRITAGGYVPFAPLPAAAWSIPKPKDATHLGPEWRLFATDSGEAWQGRCEWGGIEDGGHCDDWVWARLGGAFPLTSLDGPPDAETIPVPPGTPAAGYKVTFTPKDGDAELGALSCTGGGKTLTLPTGDSEGPFDAKSVRWVSAEPPLFVAEQVVDGFMPHGELHAFEGCEESKKFASPTLVAGPDGLVVLASPGAVTIRRAGKELLALPGADRVAFATPPATVSAMAILEKQLGGDTSMLAGDAIVLAPAPMPSAGAHLAPAGIKSVRLDAFTTDTIKDMTWFAAQLQITTTGAPQTYRAVELIDAHGKVVVASFAPLKPLVRGAAVPAIPAPTPPGPIADLLVHMREAGMAVTGRTVVFGTDPNERAASADDAKKLLGSWDRLGLALDPQVHEVRGDGYGYAVATVTFAKAGGAPYRMAALIIADQTPGFWGVAAVHFISY